MAKQISAPISRESVGLLSLLVVFAPALQLTSQSDATYWMRLTNLGDVQYTGLMRVGGQQIKAIVDTGSFELVVFGEKCVACGSAKNLYNSSKSPDYVTSGFPGSQSYGSGTTYSVEAYDKVQIGALHIPTQGFWEVVDADMPILSEDSFQAILGVGPPSSIVTFAKQEATEVHKELEEYKAAGNKVTGKVKEIVEHYDDVVTHAKNLTTVVDSLSVQNMAVCLNKESGSHGYYIWNDRRVLDMPIKFTEVSVAGDIYWSANMTSVKIQRHREVDSGASKDVKDAAKAKPVGCHDETCSAVIDTGTSLIVAPTDMAEKVFEAMQEWIEAGGTCDDLSQLPDLAFELNGKPFSLPPEAYVGVMEGEPDADLKAFMPHLYQKHQKLYETVGCQPLIMTMDADSQFGPLWIVGMPFFRKYYTNFNFVKNIGKLSVPTPTTMSFSVADSQCRPGRSAEQEKEDKMMESKASKRGVQLRVDASKLRVSSLLRKVHAKKQSSFIQKPRVHI